jgi:hypothetical protein
MGSQENREDAMKKGDAVDMVDSVGMDAGVFLKEVAHGDCVYDLSKGIEKVVQGVRDAGKKGKIELKLVFEPFKGDVNRIVVGYEVKVSPPPQPRPVSMFFSTVKNTLQRRDPNQIEFPAGAGFGE